MIVLNIVTIAIGMLFLVAYGEDLKSKKNATTDFVKEKIHAEANWFLGAGLALVFSGATSLLVISHLGLKLSGPALLLMVIGRMVYLGEEEAGWSTRKKIGGSILLLGAIALVTGFITSVT